MVAMAISTALSAYGAVSQASAQEDIANANEAAAKRNAGAALASGEADAARQTRNTQRQLASAENTLGAAGIDPSSGSALDVQADMAAEGSLDSQIARWKGQQAARGYLDQANVYSIQGSNASTAGGLTAASTLLGGAAKTAWMGGGGGGGNSSGSLW
jgi:hypothetical protein